MNTTHAGPTDRASCHPCHAKRRGLRRAAASACPQTTRARHRARSTAVDSGVGTAGANRRLCRNRGYALGPRIRRLLGVARDEATASYRRKLYQGVRQHNTPRRRPKRRMAPRGCGFHRVGGFKGTGGRLIVWIPDGRQPIGALLRSEYRRDPRRSGDSRQNQCLGWARQLIIPLRR